MLYTLYIPLLHHGVTRTFACKFYIKRLQNLTLEHYNYNYK